MILKWTPHKTAICIALALLGAWCGIAVYTMGADWWIPSIWPIAFVAYVVFIILRWERNIFRTEGAAGRSGTGIEAQNLDRPPR